jgi:hypothetical protein
LATCSVLLDRPEWLRDNRFLAEQAAWFLGAGALAAKSGMAVRSSRLFADGGTAVMTGGGAQVVVKAGPFGEGSGGHSHSDVLSVTARLGEREILIDPGTFTYIADPAERNRFRGSAAHNTVRIGGRDQAVPAGPFRWTEKPAVSLQQWVASAERDLLDAACAYGGFTHRRQVLFLKPDRIVVLDRVDGPAGEHLIEQFWHLDSPEDAERLSFSAPVSLVDTWRSRALCSREPAKALCVSQQAALPVYVAAVLDLGVAPVRIPVELRISDSRILVSRGGHAADDARWPVKFDL